MIMPMNNMNNAGETLSLCVNYSMNANGIRSREVEGGAALISHSNQLSQLLAARLLYHYKSY